ncbi:hypothetical protein LCGC14_0515570 [marine sediment metagenome]|uniref:Uncharacterized protein n=1 Tax=marine sediment metagenome TaxID=412755 RepID=A0A0F9SID3_9ZZZZ
MDYLCLSCGREFKNDLKIAVCHICLKKERKNYEKGIPPKYMTVLRYLKRESNK